MTKSIIQSHICCIDCMILFLWLWSLDSNKNAFNTKHCPFCACTYLDVPSGTGSHRLSSHSFQYWRLMATFVTVLISVGVFSNTLLLLLLLYIVLCCVATLPLVGRRVWYKEATLVIVVIVCCVVLCSHPPFGWPAMSDERKIFVTSMVFRSRGHIRH